MTIKRFITLLAVSSGALPGAMDAQQEAVTLPEAIALARRVNPNVIQALGDRRSAGAAVRTAYGQLLPSLTGTASAGQSYFPATQSRPDPVTGEVLTGESSSRSVGFGFNSSLTIFDGFRRSATISSAKASRDAADAGVYEQQAQSDLTTALAFYDALQAQGLVIVRRSGVERAREQFAVARGRLQTGAATVSDSLRGLVNLNQAELDLLTAQSQVAAAEATLARRIGRPGRVTAVDDSTFYLARPLPDTAALRAEALDRAPRVQQAAAMARARRATLKGAKGDYWPSLGISARTNLSGTQSNSYDLSRNSEISLGLTWTIFDRFQRERDIDAAAVSYDVAVATLDDSRREIDAMLTSEIAALVTAQTRIDLSATSLRAARADLQVQIERYRLGSIEIDIVQNSQDALNRAEVEALNARVDYLRSEARIVALVGHPLRED